MKIFQGLNYERKENGTHGFFINSCGRIYDIDADTKTDRVEGRADYQLLCIKKGPFYVVRDGEEQALGADTVILFKPHEPQKYYCRKNEGAEYFWVHFEGEIAEGFLKECNLLDKRIFSVILKERYIEIVERMVMEITQKHPCADVKLISLFTELVSSIGRSAESGQNDGYKKLLPALKSLEYNIDEKHSVADYAAMCSMSSSYFMHKFKEITGQTLIMYKNEVLMRKAGYMIENTGMSFSEIAFALGMEDSMYFSKKFKAYYKMTPTEYRNSERKMKR